MKVKRKHFWLPFLSAMPLLFWIGPEALERWDYAKSDGIGRTDIDTRRILRRYESTGDVKEIRNWILHGPSEGPFTQMCFVLGRWAIEHQLQFVKILESLSQKELDNFIQLFSGSLNQVSPQEFEAAFTNNSSASIQKILRELSTNRPLPWPTLTP